MHEVSMLEHNRLFPFFLLALVIAAQGEEATIPLCACRHQPSPLGRWVGMETLPIAPACLQPASCLFPHISLGEEQGRGKGGAGRHPRVASLLPMGMPPC